MKLSVCIVAYNHENYIRQCVESALLQNVDFDYEIVVSEDCSTDKTRAILEELAEKHPKKIRAQYRSRHLGAEKNFSQTISECRGEYIAFLEAGNEWTESDKLLNQVRFLDTHLPAAFCFHQVPYFDETGGQLKATLPPADPEELSDIEYLLQSTNPVSLGSIVARRSMLEGLDDWIKGLKFWDWALCMMLASRGKIGFIAKPMSAQRSLEQGAQQFLPTDLRNIHALEAFLHIVPRLTGRVQGLVSESAQNLLKEIAQEVVRGRGSAFDAVKDYYKFHALTFLSSLTFLLPEKTIQRLKRSAAKREPPSSGASLNGASAPAPSVRVVGARRYSGLVKHVAERPNVLVVTHEASRTGAPILALNIAARLSQTYNVVSLTLRDGQLLDAFCATSTSVFAARDFRRDGHAYTAMINNICAGTRFAFAVVNSLESRAVLKGLNACKVPTLTLIHEFSSYMRPTTAIADVFKLSSETVFSANVTLENALEECGMISHPHVHVLPQGKCLVPGQSALVKSGSDEVAWLTNKLRPTAVATKPFLVLGAGSVNLRKGVDLFIEVATRVTTSVGGENVRFAWIGHGYDPKQDFGYSVYLRDQVRRAGLEDKVQFLRETSEIETAYGLADLFLLSSRLDPLPNVAIDALSIGLPVLCFDRTTGIADILSRNGLSEACVARYIDTADMSEKILNLVRDGEAHEALAARCREIAAAEFDFGTYVSMLEAIGLGAKAMD